MAADSKKHHIERCGEWFVFRVDPWDGDEATMKPGGMCVKWYIGRWAVGFYLAPDLEPPDWPEEWTARLEGAETLEAAVEVMMEAYADFFALNRERMEADYARQINEIKDPEIRARFQTMLPPEQRVVEDRDMEEQERAMALPESTQPELFS